MNIFTFLAQIMYTEFEKGQNIQYNIDCRVKEIKESEAYSKKETKILYKRVSKIF